MGPVNSIGHGQAGASQLSPRPVARAVRLARWLLLACLAFGTSFAARAVSQFDVFIGYDDVVREGGWFPVACEVFNEGPPIQATFELTSGQMGSGQSRSMAIELPTNTRKRFVIPAFASSRYSTWDARLLDARGKVIQEKLNMRPKDLAAGSYLFGAVSRSFGGLPSFPDTKRAMADFQPRVARMQLEVFPDNPIALEGLNAIYINSEKALELKTPQINALIAWIYGGGQLVVAVEQPTDVNATPWLRQLLPMDFTNVVTRPVRGELQAWLTSARADRVEAGADPEPPPPPRAELPSRRGGQPVRMNQQLAQRYGMNAGRVATPQSESVAGVDPYSALQADPAFDTAELITTVGTVRDGQVVMSLQGAPLAVTAVRGRGQVTVLAFSPEREPFRSWKNRNWFWAKLLQLPKSWFSTADLNNAQGMSIDGVFGALIDSRQVRKLPVEWLLALLVVYLIVIGPLDQYWLKKINKQMLTWITFPTYVAVFSLLIYFIASKLRAGETEWNELHVVDVLPRGERAELRGRTYGSMYSPVNAQYGLTSTNQSYATLRGEFQGSWGGQETSKARVQQRGNGFDADIMVPVWTSQLFVSDWLQPAELPVSATVSQEKGNTFVSIQNHLNRDLTHVHLVLQGLVYSLDKLPAGKTSTMTLPQGESLQTFVFNNSSRFGEATAGRRQAFGRETGRLDDAPKALMAVSFISSLADMTQVVQPGFNNQAGFVAPAGLDLSALVRRGDAVLLAWDAGNTLAGPVARFKTMRGQKNTLIRLAVPVGSAPAGARKG
jgi:hypothetical protein